MTRLPEYGQIIVRDNNSNGGSGGSGSGDATAANQTTILSRIGVPVGASIAADIAAISAGDATEAKENTIIALIGTPTDTDIATDIANLATDIAGISAGDATEAKQDTIIGHVDSLETTLGTPGRNIIGSRWNSSGNLGTDTDTIITAVGTTIPNTLATIAGYIDTEVASLVASLNSLTTRLTQTIVKDDTASLDFTTEQDVISINPSEPLNLSGIVISMHNFTNTSNIRVRVYQTVNESERKVSDFTKTKGTAPDGIPIGEWSIDGGISAVTFRVTMESDGGETVTASYQYFSQPIS